MSMMLRRRMLMRMLKPALPAGYQRVEYVERPASTYYANAYNSLNLTLNGVDPVTVYVGFMATGTPESTSGSYVFGCLQTTTGNSVGYGVCITQDETTILSWDGTRCDIVPNGGNSILNRRYDIVATKTSTGQTITDGTNSNAVTDTPRAMASSLYIFGIKRYNSTANQVSFRGRIYYLKIIEGGVVKVNLIPCVDASNHVGFYDTAQQRFFYSQFYTAGQNA